MVIAGAPLPRSPGLPQPHFWALSPSRKSSLIQSCQASIFLIFGPSHFSLYETSRKHFCVLLQICVWISRCLLWISRRLSVSTWRSITCVPHILLPPSPFPPTHRESSHPVDSTFYISLLCHCRSSPLPSFQWLPSCHAVTADSRLLPACPPTPVIHFPRYCPCAVLKMYICSCRSPV